MFIQARSGKLADADLAAVVADATQRLKATAVVGSIDPASSAPTDGRSARLPFTVARTGRQGVDEGRSDRGRHGRDRAGASRRCSSRASATRPRARRSTTSSRQDFQKAEVLSIPITLIILIVAFGALLAAGIPVLLGLTSVFAAFGLDDALEPVHRRPARAPRS